MKVAFDQQVFLLQEYGGISRYICNLAEHLMEEPNLQADIFAPLHFNQHLAETNCGLSQNFKLPQLPSKLNRLVMEASKLWARQSMKKLAPDIIHETYFTNDDFRTYGAKRVLTVHDMIHERYSEMFEGSEFTIGPKYTASMRADHIICVSESTRRDLIDFCNIPIDKTSVVYHGLSDFFQISPDKTAIKNYGGTPFLLYVGKRDGYKNFDGFIRAFSNSSRLKNDFDIICFGGGVLSKDEKLLAEELGFNEGQIKLISGSDTILAQLYRDASALIYPSLYEGFGIPPLEAMASGCPVICSDTSSIPEVVGDAGGYFDPKNEDAIKTAIELVVYSETQRDDLIKKGFIQQNQFSWKKCSEETLKIYQDMM